MKQLSYFKYENALTLQAYWKLIFAFGGAFLASLASSFGDGITVAEFFNALHLALAAAGFTYIAPANKS